MVHLHLADPPREFQYSLDLRPPMTRDGKIYWKQVRRLGNKVAPAVMSEPHHLNSFAFVGNDGEIDEHQARVCYSDLQHRIYVDSPRLFIDNGWGRAEESMHTEPYQNFMRWWLKHGPYQQVFVHRSVDTVLKKGVWCRTTFPAAHICSATMPFRYADDFPHIIGVWNFLKDHTSPEFAYILSHILVPAGPVFKFSPEGYHYAIDAREWSKAMFNRFVNHDPTLKGRPTMEEGETDYVPLGLTWLEPDKHHYPVRDWGWPDIDALQAWETHDAFGMELQVHGLPKLAVKDWIKPIEFALLGE